MKGLALPVVARNPRAASSLLVSDPAGPVHRPLHIVDPGDFQHRTGRLRGVLARGGSPDRLGDLREFGIAGPEDLRQRRMPELLRLGEDLREFRAFHVDIQEEARFPDRFSGC